MFQWDFDLICIISHYHLPIIYPQLFHLGFKHCIIESSQTLKSFFISSKSHFPCTFHNSKYCYKMVLYSKINSKNQVRQSGAFIPWIKWSQAKYALGENNSIQQSIKKGFLQLKLMCAVQCPRHGNNSYKLSIHYIFLHNLSIGEWGAAFLRLHNYNF